MDLWHYVVCYGRNLAWSSLHSITTTVKLLPFHVITGHSKFFSGAECDPTVETGSSSKPVCRVRLVSACMCVVCILYRLIMGMYMYVCVNLHFRRYFTCLYELHA